MAYDFESFDPTRIPQPPVTPASSVADTAEQVVSPAGLDEVVIGSARSAVGYGTDGAAAAALGPRPQSAQMPFGNGPSAGRRGVPLIPEPDDAGSRRNAYVITGNVLGAALGVLTVAALIVSLVVAIRHEDPEPIYTATAGARSSQGSGDSGSLDYSTTGGSSTGSSTGTVDSGSTASSGTTSGDTASTGETSAADSAGTGTSTASGTLEYAPPTGKYAATGTGYRANTPPGGAGVQVSNPSFEVKSLGSGCYDTKANADPGNYTTLTFCATTDGGVVQPKNVQFLHTPLVGTLAEDNMATLNCKPPALVLPANPTPGQSGDLGGDCVGSSSSNKVPGTYRQTGTYSILAKETVAGVEAIHLRQDIKQEPADSKNTQHGTMGQDIWFAPNGLIVRFAAKIDATSCIVTCQAMVVKFHDEFDLTVTSTTPS